MFFFIQFSELGATEVASYCFKENKDYWSAKKDVEDLLISNEKFLARNNEECFDLILNGSHRREIFDKLLAKRYQLITSFVGGSKDLTEEHCQVEFITVTNADKNTSTISLGNKSNVQKTNESKTINSTQTIMVQKSYPASIQVGDAQLNLTCEKLSGTQYLLNLSHGSNSGTVKTSVRVIKGVKHNLAATLQELNDKKSTLGIPKTEWIKTEGIIGTTYDLVVQ